MSQREIKFRIWDSQFDRFLYKLPQPMHLAWERFTVEQFTGLKDKNDVDIYEGDVVLCASFSFKCSHLIEWDTEIGGKFVGGMPGWHLSELAKNGGEGYAWTGSEERIGNVHENPELLEKINSGVSVST